MRAYISLITLLLTLPVVVAASPTQTIRLKEHLDFDWTDELISYPLEEGLQSSLSIKVVDETGSEVASQVHEGRVHLLVSLPANAEKRFLVSAGKANVAPDRAVTITKDGDWLIVDNGVVALRLPAGSKSFDAQTKLQEVPGPLQGVRYKQGKWIGRSWIQSPLRPIGYSTTVNADGPLFADVTVEYRFEGDKHYRFNVRAIAGQPTVIVSETMDLNSDGKYRMLSYDNDEDASTWEWWDYDELEHPANVIFSFYDGLEPNQCRWRGHHPSHPNRGVTAHGNVWISDNLEGYAPLTYPEAEQFNRLAGWWINSFADRSNYFTFYNDRDPSSPVISLGQGRPSQNINPTTIARRAEFLRFTTAVNDLRIWTMKSKDLRVVAPIVLGSRQWLLIVEPQSALPRKGADEECYPYKAVVKYSYFPLDKVKDWSLDWKAPISAWPRLFCREGDMAGMKSRVAAAPQAMQSHGDIPAIYRPNGTAQQMAEQALNLLRQNVHNALTGTGHGGMNWFHGTLHIIRTMPMYDAAMGTEGIDPETRAKIQAYGAFIAHRSWDDDYWPPKEAGNGWGSANMGVLAAGGRVLSAVAVAGHPMQQQWLARSKGYLLGNVNEVVAEDGSSLSCPHYLEASMNPVMYMALALKFGGSFDLFREDPRFERFGQFVMDLLTPVDPRVNLRTVWPVGDSVCVETIGMLDMLALGYAGVDEKLAGALRYMAQEMGQTSHGGNIPYALLSNTTSEPVEPELRSRFYRGYGAFFRDGMKEESWLAYRKTKFAFDHFHTDQGAFTYYAKGVPMMLDFGSMYSPRTDQGIYHNRVVWDVQEGNPRPCPGNQTEKCFYKGLTYFEHQYEPWTAKGEYAIDGMSYTDSYGEIHEFATLLSADYLSGDLVVRGLRPEPYFPESAVGMSGDPNQKYRVEKIEPFTWQRRVLMVKAQAEEDPQFVLVRDDFEGQCPPPTASFWIMANEVRLESDRAYAVGQFGVDLHLYVAQPSEPELGLWHFEHKTSIGERQLSVRVTQPEGRPFLTLMYPRRPSEPEPTFATIADGDGVKVAQPEHGIVDYAFLANRKIAWEEGATRFEGSAGAIRVMPRGALITLSAGGKGSAVGLTVEAERAVVATVSAERIVLNTYGEAQKIRLSGDRMQKMGRGPMEIAIGEGENEVVVE